MDDDMANIIVAQLLYLDAVDPKKVCGLFFEPLYVLLFLVCIHLARGDFDCDLFMCLLISEQDIVMYVNSPGGSVTAGINYHRRLSCYDYSSSS